MNVADGGPRETTVQVDPLGLEARGEQRVQCRIVLNSGRACSLAACGSQSNERVVGGRLSIPRQQLRTGDLSGSEASFFPFVTAEWVVSTRFLFALLRSPSAFSVACLFVPDTPAPEGGPKYAASSLTFFRA